MALLENFRSRTSYRQSRDVKLRLPRTVTVKKGYPTYNARHSKVKLQALKGWACR